MPDYQIPLRPDGIYHFLSRANGDEKLFREEENYRFFLARMKKHILPVANVLSYCLLPHHFHLLAKIKTETIIEDYFSIVKRGKSYDAELAPDFLMERFSNLLNSYSKSYNKVYNRTGSLFVDFLKRVKIETPIQLHKTSFYIHNNPVYHGYCERLTDWKWSSYWSIINEQQDLVSTQKLLDYFDNIEMFREYHLHPGLRVNL